MLVKNILNYVESKDMTISDFAKKCKLRPTTVFSIINGQTKNPTLEVLTKISKAMNMTLDELTKSKKKDIDEATKLYHKMKNLNDNQKNMIYSVMQTMITEFEKEQH